MASDHVRMAMTAGQVYAAMIAATAETGTRALRATAHDAARTADDLASALRTSPDQRGIAIEHALVTARDAQVGQLRMMRGMATYWNIAFLHGVTAARARTRF